MRLLADAGVIEVRGADGTWLLHEHRLGALALQPRSRASCKPGSIASIHSSRAARAGRPSSGARSGRGIDSLEKADGGAPRGR